MKRLNCTYEIKQDNNFPWLLKHPKVKKGLAKFKTAWRSFELVYALRLWNSSLIPR
nr:hypothetical protein [Mycoplasmopsis bovis]